MATPAPTRQPDASPDPDPRQTPVKMPEGAYLATVSNIDEDSTQSA